MSLLNKMADEREDIENAAGVAGIGAGAVALNKSNPLVTGMERLYHGTDNSNAKSIRENGLLAAMAGEGKATNKPGIREQIGEENIRGKTYTTRNKMTANQYAAQQAGDTIQTPLGPIISRNKNQEEILNIRIPYQDIQQGKVKEVENPELKGMNKKDWVESKLSLMPDMPFGKQLLEKAYDSLDAPNTLTVEGDIPTQYIKGSDDYAGQTLKGLGSYVKNNPARFTKGIGLGGAGLGGIGIGGATLYDNFKEAFWQDFSLVKEAASKLG